MRNAEIRSAMKEIKMPQWKLAELLGCHENTVQRKLRKEIPEPEKSKLLSIIRDYGNTAHED